MGHTSTYMGTHGHTPTHMGTHGHTPTHMVHPEYPLALNDAHPTNISPELHAMLKQLCIVGEAHLSDGEERAYATMLARRARASSLYHAVLEIMDCILCKTLSIKWTDEYIDVWEGTCEIRRAGVSQEVWTGIEQCGRAMTTAGIAIKRTSRTNRRAYVYVFPSIGASNHDDSIVDHLPWRMNALRSFIGALMQIGYKCVHLQCEIVQAVQVAARQTCHRLSIDAGAARMIYFDEHRQCVIESLPLVSDKLARAWHTPNDAPRDTPTLEHM